MSSLLFVCTGNSCRSPMAAALSRRYLRSLGEDLEVSSAGLHASSQAPASESAQRVALEMGEDLSLHRARSLDRKLIEGSDLVLTMTKSHAQEILRKYPTARGRVYSLAEFSGLRQGEDLADPFGGDLEVYRRTWRLIEEHIRAAIPRILERLRGPQRPIS